jgi:hypothetical protein
MLPPKYVIGGRLVLDDAGCGNVNLGSQCAMDGTHLCDLEQSNALCWSQISSELKRPFDAIQPPGSCLAFRTVRRVNLGMREPNGHFLERPSFSPRVQRDVIDAQLPSAASSRSYGVGPVSVPPFGIGSSATS